MNGDVAFLLDFISARVAEDEAVARAAWPATWTTDGNSVVSVETGLRAGYEDMQLGVAHLAMTVGKYQKEARNAVHIARWSPASVIAWCAVVREVVERARLAEREVDDNWADYSAWLAGESVSDRPPERTVPPNEIAGLRAVLRIIAGRWAAHPHYRAAWAAA